MSDEFSAAGEFYGHLVTAMGFGDLTMRYDGQWFVYQWQCKITNRQLSAEILVTDAQSMQARFLADFAKTVVARWEREMKEPRG